MRRAFEPLRVCIGKAGSMLALLIFIFFGFLNLGYSQLPLSTGAPHVGQKAPGFTLPDQHGKSVSLADLLKPAARDDGAYSPAPDPQYAGISDTGESDLAAGHLRRDAGKDARMEAAAPRAVRGFHPASPAAGWRLH